MSIEIKGLLHLINSVWAKSLASVLCLILGVYLGELNAESRIVSDCKFSNTFRVDIQSFNCQRRI